MSYLSNPEIDIDSKNNTCSLNFEELGFLRKVTPSHLTFDLKKEFMEVFY